MYAIPRIEVEGLSVVTNTTPDDDDPRRREARGDAGDRAHGRPLRRGDRHGSRRGAAEELHRQGRLPVPDRVGCDVRLGRLRGRARPRAALGRLRRAAGRAAASPRRGRHGRAGDRDQLVHRDHEPAGRGGVRRGRDHRRRRRDRAHRLVLARPGSRDDLRDDRGRAARVADREDHGRQGRHRRRAQRHGHVRLQVDPDRRHGRQRRRRRGGRAARRSSSATTWRRAPPTSSSTRRWAGSTSPERRSLRSRGRSSPSERPPTAGSTS